MFKSRMLNTSAVVHAPVAAVAPIEQESEGLGEYSKEAFKEMGFGEYRTRFPKETEGLTDKAVWDVIATTDDDMSDDEWKKLLSSAPRSDLPNLDGEALVKRAEDFAAEAGDECDAVVNGMADAALTLELGKFRLLFALQSDYDADQLAAFPVPDEEEGNNPDHFKGPTVKADGSAGTAWTSFYTKFADATKAGRNILKNIEWLERAGNVTAMKDDIPAEIKELNPNQRATKLAYWIGRRGTLRKAYKNSMKLFNQFNAVNEMDGFQAEPMWMEGASPAEFPEEPLKWEIENTTKCVQVWLTPEEGKPMKKWEAMSAGAFLKLNVKKAIEKGGTFANLIESGIVPKKKPGTGAKSDTPKGFRIETIDTGLDVLAEFHSWLVDKVYGDKNKAEIGKLYKKLKETDNNEMVTAVIELRNALQEIAKDCGLDAKYIKLQQTNPDLISKTGT